MSVQDEIRQCEKDIEALQKNLVELKKKKPLAMTGMWYGVGRLILKIDGLLEVLEEHKNDKYVSLSKNVSGGWKAIQGDAVDYPKTRYRNVKTLEGFE